MVTGVLADRFPAELHLFRTYQPTLNKPAEKKGQNEQFEPIKDPTGECYRIKCQVSVLFKHLYAIIYCFCKQISC